jgi:integrase
MPVSPPHLRAGSQHIEGYVLDTLGDLPITEVSPRDILGLRLQLLQRGLSLKYVKNIIGGSFKAMLRDARAIDRVVMLDPFVGVRWGRAVVPGPEPFTAEERSRILAWFERKRFGFHCGERPKGPACTGTPPYYALVHMLFWTGMRPSEAAALRWTDVELDARVVRIVRSRHLYEESAPKTAQAVRTVELFPETVHILRTIEPLRVTPETYVFMTTSGRAIEPKAFSTHWYRCLRALGIRVRGCTRRRTPTSPRR